MNRIAAISSTIVILLIGCAVWMGLGPDGSPAENWRSVNQEVKEALIGPLSDIGSPNQDKPTLPLDLNLASETELDALPGIGPAKAKAIIEYRSSIGRFQSLDQLLEVKGIGPKIYDGLRSSVTIGASP